jgi:Protein of unknown function (DUF551)
MEWIKCTDRMPKPFSSVLVPTVPHGKRKPRVVIAEYCVHKPGHHDYETGFWLDEFELMDPQPTIWMPVPELPKP